MESKIHINEGFIKEIDKNGILDLSYLNNIRPYKNDYIENLKGIDIAAEISQLEKEMNEINLENIPFTSSDFVIIFLAGLLGGICDVVLGKPADGYDGVLKKAQEPKINDDFALGLGKHLKQFDLKNNPIDKHIPGIPVGDHRLYSYGHDLLRFFQTIPVIMSGTGKVGISGLGGIVNLEQAPGGYPGVDSVWKAIIVLSLHLYKDYCSARSLPIPGSTLLASLNNNKMPEFLDKLTNEMEFNLRTVNGQILSVATIEIMIGIYMFIKRHSDKDEQYTKEQYNEKKSKMLLMSHTIAMLFNVGKVAVTKNPAFINFPQILRIVTLAWKVCKDEINKSNLALEKVNMSVLKNKLQTMDTLLLLDESIYYTKQIDRIIAEMKTEFDEINDNRNENIIEGFDELEQMMAQLKELNN
jgi:hypothetical protein